MENEKKKASREYPLVYEKAVPVLLLLLVLVVVGVLFAAVGVALGWIA